MSGAREKRELLLALLEERKRRQQAAPGGVLAVMDSSITAGMSEARATVAELIEAAERAVHWMDAVVRTDTDAPKSNGIRSWKAEMRYAQLKAGKPEWLYKPTMTAAQARRQLTLERENAQVLLQAALAAATGGAK